MADKSIRRSFKATVRHEREGTEGICCYYSTFQEAAQWAAGWPYALEAHIVLEAEVTTPNPEILCPFCGAPWSKHAMALWDDAECYDTSGGGSPVVCIRIRCTSCNRVMYQKDGVDRG